MNFDDFGGDVFGGGGGGGGQMPFKSGGSSFADRHPNVPTSPPKEPSSGLWLVWQIFYPICLGLVNFCLVIGAWLWFKHPLYLFRLLRWLQTRRCGFVCRNVTVDGATYRLAEKGRCDKFKTSLLLIHGLADDLSSWNSFVELIDPQVEHVIAVDLPGHGGSLVSQDEEFDLAPLARRVHSVLRAAGYERQPLHAVGYSMGATVAGLYAALYADQTDLLTMVAPLMDSGVENEFRKRLGSGSSAWLVPSTYEELTMSLRHRAYKPVAQASQVMVGMLEDRLPKIEFHQALLANVFEEVNAKALEQQAPDIRAAVQLVWGQQDEISPVAGANVLKQKLQNLAQQDILDECGHSLEMESAETLYKLVYKFRKNQSLKKFS